MKIKAQLVHDARRKCNGGTVHAVEQLLLCYPLLIEVYNRRPSQAAQMQIEDLENRLYALANREG